jgi:uncharacterized membrane protein
MSLHALPARPLASTARWTPTRLALLAAAVQATLAVASIAPEWSYGKVGREKFVSDVTLYRTYAGRLLGGEVPYRDYVVEYPPLALPVFVLPRLFAGDPRGFGLAFAVEMALCQAAAVLLATRLLARRREEGRIPARLAFGTAAFAVLCPLAVCRFDAAPALLTFAAALAWLSGRAGAGGALAGLGVLMKVYPGVIAAPALAAPRRYRGWAVLGSIVAVGAAGWFALASGGEMARSLRYHLDRGLEIESSWSGLLMLVRKLAGWSLDSTYRFACIELKCPFAGRLARLAFPLQAAALGLVAWRAWKTRLRHPMTLAASAVLAFALFGKVLSPQYLVWLLPFVMVLEGRAGDRSQWAFLAACGLTTLLYPWAIERLAALDLRAIVLLNARNAILLGLWAAWTFGPTPGRRPGDAGGTP